MHQLIIPGIELLSGKYDFSFFPSQEHKVYAGISSNYYRFQQGNKVPLGISSQVVPEQLQEKHAMESSIFAGHDYNHNSGLSVFHGDLDSPSSSNWDQWMSIHIWMGYRAPSIVSMIPHHTQSLRA